MEPGSGVAPSTCKIREQYVQDGYVFPLDGVPVERARHAADNVEALVTQPPEIRHPWNIKSHLLFDWVYELATDTSVLHAVSSAIGPDFSLEGADIFHKPASSESWVSYHQDANYWGLDPYEICTAWIALTDANEENGCMWYIPASHTSSKLKHEETIDPANALTRGQTIPVGLDEKSAVPVILNSGQFALHHCLLAHSSGPNRSGQSRTGLAVRFLPSHVRQTAGPPMSAIHISGARTHRGFRDDPPPTGSLTPRNIAAHDRTMAPHAVNSYATA